jgi:GDP-L-fucose synthase
MKLLTGASGMIGLNIKHSIPDLLTPTHHELDLTDRKKVEAYLSATKPEMIIHCASNDGEVCLKENLEMFINLAETRIPMIAFCTGLEVDNRPEKSGEYVLSKYIARELAFWKYPHIAMIRLWGCFGKYEKPTRFISENILRVLQDKPILVKENKLFSYVYVNDLVKIIEKIKPISDIYRIVGYTESLLSYAQIIKKVTNSPYEIIVEKSNFGASYVGINDYTFEPTPLEQGIKELYEWWKGYVEKELEP